MSVKEKYIAALNDEQAKMVSYVKQMTAKVAFPETAVTTTYVKPAKHTIVSAACLIGGAITIAAGLCLEKNGISTAGGVAVACGAGLWAIDRNKKPVVQRDVAFYKVTSHYYKSLSDIFKYVTMAKTEHSHPLGMVVSTHFRCGKGVKRGLKNGALPFNID